MENEGPCRTIRVQGWRITTCKKPISGASELDHVSQKLGIPLPEMYFGGNYAEIEHEASGYQIRFDAFHALEATDRTGQEGPVLQVPYAKEWSKTRNLSDSVGQAKPYDWTYSSTFAGYVRQGKDGFKQDMDAEIPVALLQQPDPILFYDEMTLYEDELGDNGTSHMTLRLRVMPERLLLLCRLLMRVDGVLVRLFDTRLFVEFADGRVLRECTLREAPYSRLQALLARTDDSGSLLNDMNWVASHIGVSARRMESILLPIEAAVSSDNQI